MASANDHDRIDLRSVRDAAAQDSETVVVLTHDSFAISEEVLQSFEELSGIAVEILRSGDAGQMVNQAILSKNHPLGDVLYGVDNTFLSRALEAEIFAAYRSPQLDSVTGRIHSRRYLSGDAGGLRRCLPQLRSGVF